MPCWLRRTLNGVWVLTLVLACLMGAAVVCVRWPDVPSGALGSVMARWDAAHGRYRILLYGLTVRDDTQAPRAQPFRYVFKGCVLRGGDEAYAKAYNGYMSRAIRERFGVTP